MSVSVLAVASEVFPLIKTGGLADVAGALPAALAAEGVRVVTLVPGYPAVLAALGATVAHPPRDTFGGPARLLAGQAAGLDLLVLDAPHLFARPGNPYQNTDRRDWPDNAFRFAALARVAADIAMGALGGWRPDVLHAHDWQAGLAPAYLHYAGARVPSVMTIHNLAFQGWFPAELRAPLGLPEGADTIEGVEYFGGIGFLKAGLRFATKITTVSPTYAAEIQTREGGMALDGLLRARAADLCGIINGIDTVTWDPARDAAIPQCFDIASIDRRERNKAALRRRMGLSSESRGPLFGAITRLTAQKGSDLLAAVLPEIAACDGQFVLLGSGEPALEESFRRAAAAEPNRHAVMIGYDEALAHQIQAGTDVIVVPSRFEPCGLTQLCALRYGSIPLVAAVGGLADTVTEATGFRFHPVDRGELAAAVARTAERFADAAAWRAMQRAGMGEDVSWARPARSYARLYAEARA